MLETGYNTQEIKKMISEKVEDLVEGAALTGSINYFQIIIKHENGEITTEFINKYNEKIM